MVNLLSKRHLEMRVGILRVVKCLLKEVNLLVAESHPTSCMLTHALTLVAAPGACHFWDQLSPPKHGWHGYESMLFIPVAWESHDSTLTERHCLSIYLGKTPLVETTDLQSLVLCHLALLSPSSLL